MLRVLAEAFWLSLGHNQHPVVEVSQGESWPEMGAGVRIVASLHASGIPRKYLGLIYPPHEGTHSGSTQVGLLSACGALICV